MFSGDVMSDPLFIAAFEVLIEFKIERHLPGSGSSMIILPIC